jgi:hypothetical protein
VIKKPKFVIFELKSSKKGSLPYTQLYLSLSAVLAQGLYSVRGGKEEKSRRIRLTVH